MTSQTSFKLPLSHQTALKWPPLASRSNPFTALPCFDGTVRVLNTSATVGLETASYPPLTLALVWAFGSDFEGVDQVPKGAESLKIVPF